MPIKKKAVVAKQSSPWHEAATAVDIVSETPVVIIPEEPKHDSEVPVVQPVQVAETPAESLSSMNLSEPEQKRSLLPILVSSLLFLIIGFLAGYFMSNRIFISNFFKKTPSEIMATSISPTITPSPSNIPTKVTKSVDLTQYSIKVLNGSGVGGEAAKAQELLAAGGFVVDSVGNATRSNFAQTIIQSSPTVDKAYLDQLKTELEKKYTLGPDEELPSKQTVDVLVIIGKK